MRVACNHAVLFLQIHNTVCVTVKMFGQIGYNFMQPQSKSLSLCFCVSYTECHSVVSMSYSMHLKEYNKFRMFIVTFRAMTKPEGLWRTLLTTPPFPAPNSHIGSKSSSFSSPTWAFWVRKASRRLRCCSSRSNSPSFFCKASRLALWARQEVV